jgi:hypothetical protein
LYQESGVEPVYLNWSDVTHESSSGVAFGLDRPVNWLSITAFETLYRPVSRILERPQPATRFWPVASQGFDRQLPFLTTIRGPTLAPGSSG